MFQPGWGNDVASYWPTFEARWRARSGALPEEAYSVGKLICDNFTWLQDELSSKPHTFNHGDVKPPNMFMMPGGMPAFIDWQVRRAVTACDAHAAAV